MSDIKEKKELIAAELSKLNRGIVEAANRYKIAKDAGKDDEAQSYTEMGKGFYDKVITLQNQFSDLSEEEAKPELERIQKLGEELRKPLPATMPVSYFMGGMSGTPTISPVEQKERQREIIGELLKTPPSAGGRQSEQLPSGVRFGVGALPTPESEAEYLKQKYPDANITPITVAGNTEYLIKNKDKSVFTTLDKGVAGTAGMLAVEGSLTAAEIAAGLTTTAATKSPMAGNLAAGATRATLGPIADSITRASLGMPPKIGESIMRRGTEAGIGVAIGVGTDFAIPAIRASRIKSDFGNDFVRTLDESRGRLMAREEQLAASQGRPVREIQVPLGARIGGQEGMRAQSELAGAYPRSNITSAGQQSQEALSGLFRDYVSEIPVDPSNYASIAIQKEAQRKALINSIAQNNKTNTNIVEGAVSRLVTNNAKVNADNLGEFIRGTMSDAENRAIKLRDDQYDLLAQIANDAGFQIEAKQLLDALPSIKARIDPSGAFDKKAVSSIEEDLMKLRDAPVAIYDAEQQLKIIKRNIKALENEQTSGEKITKARIAEINRNKLSYEGQAQNLSNKIKELNNMSGPLDFKGFDAYIRRFNDARPENVVGGTTTDVFSSEIASELSKLRRDTYGKISVTYLDGTTKNLGDEFEKASALVQRRGAFEKNTLGGILKEAAGEQSTTNRDIVSAAIKEPFTINRVLQAAKQLEADNPAQAGVASRLQEMMSEQYLNNLKTEVRRGAPRLDYDPQMIESLYGSKSASVARGLDSLNDQLIVLRKSDIPNMTLTDLNELSGALGKDARDAVAANIIKRNALQQQEESLVRSEIFKLAQKGDFKNIDADTLSKLILSSSPESTIANAEAIMKQLSKASPESRNLFKGDFTRNLLRDYPGGEPTVNAPFQKLFDNEKLISDFEAPGGGDSELFKKIKIVLGEEEALRLYDMAKLYQANAITTKATPGFTPRMFLSDKGATLGLPIGKVTDSVKNRLVTAMLSNERSFPMLRSALARNSLSGGVNAAYNKMARDMFVTRTGLTALAYQASSDPDFSAELVKMAKEFSKKEGLNLEQE